MKKLEISTLIILIIALIFKLMQYPGGDVLIGLGLSLLAMVYYPLGFFVFNSIRLRKILKRESYKGITFWRGFGAVATGIAFSILIMGIVFKLLLFPGASVMLGVGLVTTGISLIVTFIKYISNKESTFYKRMLIRATIIGFFGLTMNLIPGTSIVKFSYRDHPGYVKAYIELQENPDDPELQQKLDEEFEKMNGEE